MQEVHERLLTQSGEEQLPTSVCYLTEQNYCEDGDVPRQMLPSTFSTTQHQPPHLPVISDLDYNMILAVFNQTNTDPVLSAQSALT